MAVCIVAAVVGAAWPVFAQRNNDNKGRQQATRSPQEQQDVQALVLAVDAALMTDTGIPVPTAAASATPPAAPTPKPLALGAPDRAQGDIPIKWEINHFVKGATDTYMPFTINVDRSGLAGGAAVYVRIVNAEQANAFAAMMAKMATPPQGNNKNQPPAARPTFAWDSINFIDVPEDGRLSRAVQLKPGQYAMFVAVKEKTPASAASAGGKNDRKGNDKNQAAVPPAAAPGKVGVLRHDLMVPDFTANDLTTSSVIIAKQVEQVTAPPADQESNPYVFGPMKITPSVDGKFTKKDELSVIFWIYGAQAAATGKPDVTIDFNFYQRLAEEKYFNKTAPQQLNAQTLPPEFSVAAGHQLPGSLVVPLSSFPAGDYRLEIKVTDKPSGKTVTQNVNFTISG